jgi:hypothetical protein
VQLTGGIAVNHLVSRVPFPVRPPKRRSSLERPDHLRLVLVLRAARGNPSQLRSPTTPPATTAADEVGGLDAIRGRHPELPNPATKVPPFTSVSPHISVRTLFFLLLSLLFDPSRLCWCQN